MMFDNLVGITLERIEVDSDAINRLLDAATRNIVDARIELMSNENRFDVAYKAIMQIAKAALLAKGFRTLTSKPGHHQTMIQSLARTLMIDKATIILLDALRKQRNIVDYSGDVVTESAMNECILQAEELLKTFRKCLRASD